MRKYKVLTGAIGNWRKGDVITDDDLKAAPQFGGADTLKNIEAIEDHYDRPPQQPAPAVVTRTASDAENRSPEKTTGHDDPNVGKGHGRSGKS